jgi:hypothetical protein
MKPAVSVENVLQTRLYAGRASLIEAPSAVDRALYVVAYDF